MAMLAGVANPYVTHIIAIMSHHGPTTVGVVGPGEAPKKSLRDLPPGTTRTADQKEFTLSYEYFEDQSQYDALDALKSCPKPKLFFYGTEDILVTPESVKHMYEQSADPKVIKELRLEHDYRLYPNIVDEVNAEISKFLDV